PDLSDVHVFASLPEPAWLSRCSRPPNDRRGAAPARCPRVRARTHHPAPDAIGGGSYPDRGNGSSSTRDIPSRGRPGPPPFSWMAPPTGGMVSARGPGHPGARRRQGTVLVRSEGTIMSTHAEVRLARRVLRHELEAIRGNWGWFLALGIVLVVVGTLAIAMP